VLGVGGVVNCVANPIELAHMAAILGYGSN
jgi:hypothetical protein